MIETAPCVRCGSPTEFDPDVALKAIGGVCCQECSVAEFKERETREENQKRIKRWDALCPERFRDTLFEKLPCHEPSERALKWPFTGGAGLNLWGFPDTGKTRTLFLILHREIHAGKKAIVFGPGDFSVNIEKQAYHRAEWIQALMKVDFLGFDDMDKMSLTGDHESVFFAILDKRMSNRLPCLFTHNSTANDLEYKFRNGKAMVRRIRQFTQSIHYPSRQTQML